MAVERRWVRHAVLGLSVTLLLLILAQIGAAFSMNFLAGFLFFPSSTQATVAAAFSGSSELVTTAVFLTPTVWLGVAAAMSRHRGVYITLAIFSCLSLLDAVAFLVYEAYSYTEADYFLVSSGVQAIAITKIVLWALKLLLFVALTSVAIAASCARPRRKRSPVPYGYFGPQLMAPPPPAYPRQQERRSKGAPSPRYLEYGYPAPAQYYR